MVIVTFKDPLVNNEEISYHLSEKLEPKWKELGQMVIKRNKDRVYVVFGFERSGKSTWTFQQAKYIDSTFNIDRICFTPEQFLEQIRITPPGCVVVFDEAFRGFSSKSTLSKVNKLLVQAMMEIGRKNLIIFIVLPSFNLLENYVAVHRSNALFQIYEKKDSSYRGWRCYNRKKKAQMYFKSKRNYGIVPYTKTKITGKFFIKKIDIDGVKVPLPYVTFDIMSYDNKKSDAFGSNTAQKEDNPYKDRLEELEFNLNQAKCPIPTRKELAERIKVSYPTLVKWKRNGG